MCPDLGKKGSNCVHPWVESSIQNVALRVSRRKNSKVFPCGVFFCVLDEKFIEVPWFHKTSSALKHIWLRACKKNFNKWVILVRLSNWILCLTIKEHSKFYKIKIHLIILEVKKFQTKAVKRLWFRYKKFVRRGKVSWICLFPVPLGSTLIEQRYHHHPNFGSSYTQRELLF